MRSQLSVRARKTRLVVAGLSIAIAAGAVLFATGVTPWLAPAACTLALCVAAGQRLSWAAAFAGAIVVQFAAACVAIRFTAAFPWDLAVTATTFFIILGLVAVAYVATRDEVRLPTTRGALSAFSVALIVGAAVWIIVARAAAGANFEWAMHNDAVWNLATTRFIILDGGLDSDLHPNSSPLTATLMAAVASSGRAGLATTDLLRHDITRVAEFWLLAGLGTGVLGGLLGFRAAAGRPAWWRWVAAAVVGALPMTWFVFGFATDYGFYNATIVVVLLLATWILWLEVPSSPVISSTLLSLSAVCLLATWAPLALIPLALSVTALINPFRTALAPPERRWSRAGALLLPLLPVPLYGVLVTLPDLRRDGAALAVEGAFMPFAPLHLFTTAVVAAIVVLMLSAWLGDRPLFIGFSALVAAGAVALGYLMYQRRETPSLWGYYPAKLGWFVATMLLVVIAYVLVRAAAQNTTRALSGALAALSVLVPVTLMSHLAPPGGWRTALTPVAIALNLGSAAPSTNAANLFDLADDGTATMVLSYGGDATDRFINGWLLQLESSRSTDPIRLYSYILSPEDEEQACEALIAWDREVRVVTSDEDLESRLRRSCRDADFTIELRPAPATG